MSILKVVGSGQLVEPYINSTGVLDIPATPFPPLTLPNLGGAAFAPIGPNLPLTVEIAYVYTGKYPNNPNPLLITSALKNLDQTNAASQAVNCLVPRVTKHTGMAGPSADQQGTKLVCYVPAVIAVSSTITFTMMFEKFPDHAFSMIGGLFSGLSAMPLFLTGAGPYLMGAGAILKLTQDIGDAIFNGHATYAPTMVLNFSDIGLVSESGYQVFFKCEDDPAAPYKTFTFTTNEGLIDPRTGSAYAGDAPYFVIAIDGQVRNSLKGFTALAASASQMAMFFNIKEGGTVPVADLLAIFSAAQDVKNGKAAMGLSAAFNAASPGENTDMMRATWTAHIADIQDPELAECFARY